MGRDWPMRCLRFDGRIPPGVEEIDIVGGGEVETDTAGLEAEQKQRRAVLGLEAFHALLAVPRLAVEVLECDLALVEFGLQESKQRSELGEDESLVALVDNLFELLQKEIELGARGVGFFDEQLGMASGLAEPQQRLKDVQFGFGKAGGSDLCVEIFAHLRKQCVVNLTLVWLEFAVQDLLGALRKVAGHLLLRAAENEGAEGAA
jgi:hypothetical protein